MSEFSNIVREMADGTLDGVSEGVIIAMSVVVGLLIIASTFAFGILVIFQSAMYATTKSRTVAVRRASRLPEKYLIITNLGISRFQRPVRSCSATVTVTISKK